jgi:hypothetical protein
VHARRYDRRGRSGLRRARLELLEGLSAMTYSFFTTLLLLGPLAGCVQAYKPPTAGEPHAVLKIRRTYETKAGATLTERVMVDEYLALEQQVPVRAVPESDTGAVLLHPATAKITVKALFTHEELKHVQENYTEQESYSAQESYSCGSLGTFKTCYRTVTRYRTKHRTRMVHKYVPVVDGTCEPSFTLAPRIGGIYLVQFTYQDRNVCSLSCFEQASHGDGTFKQRECPSAPFPKD